MPPDRIDHESSDDGSSNNEELIQQRDVSAGTESEILVHTSEPQPDQVATSNLNNNKAHRPSRELGKHQLSSKALFVTTGVLAAIFTVIGNVKRDFADNPGGLEEARFLDDLKSFREKSNDDALSAIQELHLRYALLADASRVKNKHQIPIGNFFNVKNVQFTSFSSETGETIENALRELELLASAEEPLDLDTAEGRKAAEPIKTLRAAATMQKDLIPRDKAATLTPSTIKQILGKTIQRLLVDWDGTSPLNNAQLYYIAKNISGLLTDFPEEEAEKATKDLLKSEFSIVLSDEEWGAFWQELQPEIIISRAAFIDDESVPSSGDVASR